jgi:hypothetical protein
MYSDEGAAFRGKVARGMVAPRKSSAGKKLLSKGAGWLARALAAYTGNAWAAPLAGNLVEGAVDSRLGSDAPRGPLADVIDNMGRSDNYRRLNDSASQWAKNFMSSGS